MWQAPIFTAAARGRRRPAPPRNLLPATAKAPVPVAPSPASRPGSGIDVVPVILGRVHQQAGDELRRQLQPGRLLRQPQHQVRRLRGDQAAVGAAAEVLPRRRRAASRSSGGCRGSRRRRPSDRASRCGRSGLPSHNRSRSPNSAGTASGVRVIVHGSVCLTDGGSCASSASAQHGRQVRAGRGDALRVRARSRRRCDRDRHRGARAG